MINKKKVRLMARTAMYEQHEGPKDFAMSKYMRIDYVGLHLWTTGIAVTVSYILILILLVACNFEYLVSNLTKINYGLLVTLLIVAYIGMMALFMLVAFFVYSYRYKKSEAGLSMYFGRLRKIYKMNKEDSKRKN